MNHVKNLVAPDLGDENPGSAKRRVTHNRAFDAGETDLSELEQGGRFFIDGTLFLGQVGEVDIQERVSDGVDNGRFLLVVVLTRQGVPRPGTCAMSVANSLMNASWCHCRFETGSRA